MKIGKIDDKIIYLYFFSLVKSQKMLRPHMLIIFCRSAKETYVWHELFQNSIKWVIFFNSNLIYLVITRNNHRILFFFLNKKKTLAFKIKIHSLKRYENALSFYLDKRELIIHRRVRDDF